MTNPLIQEMPGRLLAPQSPTERAAQEEWMRANYRPTFTELAAERARRRAARQARQAAKA